LSYRGHGGHQGRAREAGRALRRQLGSPVGEIDERINEPLESGKLAGLESTVAL